MGVKDKIKKAALGVKKVTKKVAKNVKYAGEVGVAGAKLAGRLANPVRQAKFAVDAARGEGFVLPGSKYIGPGNRMDKGKPVNQADANAYQHDVDYDNYLKKGHKAKDVYLGYSDADQRLLKNTKANTPEGLAVVLGMGAKKLLNKTGLTKRIRDTDVVGGGGASKKVVQPRVAARGNPSAAGVSLRKVRGSVGTLTPSKHASIMG